MALDSFECRIITGGFNHCDNTWNKASDELDRCFKIYHPVKGGAIINIDGIEYPIQKGNVYLISGFHIESQRCSSFMDVYWLHFIPYSLYLRHIMLNSRSLHVWSETNISFVDDFNLYIKKLFRGDFKTSNITSLPFSFEEAKLHSYILHFIAETLKDTPSYSLEASGDIKKLTPSVTFMNNEFRNNPPLETIAQKSKFAPNYFHRMFKKNFGLTPHGYMLRLRMEYAIKLLTSTEKSVKEVACECGYENEFYFQRQFKKHYKYSPGKLKKLRPF
ncbi:helix-turn-helix domain-containing protein [Mariniphaga sediminis]|uniref:helix-turn-helix domain-containing protein n=1 Tax=Mariniphaga sediminis TaxID=1628158 RepID=UPI00356A8787